MLDAHALRGHLPHLRRHVFLLTASRTAADCAVAMTLARLPRDAANRPYADGRGHLYRQLHEATGQLICPPDGRVPPLHARLLAMAPPQRALLLLVAVEAMPLALAAEIMGMDEDAAAGTLASARACLDARFMPALSRLA